MKDHSTAVAYPGLPIIFAEGLRDYGERISFHNSVGCAFTDESEGVRTETTVEARAGETTFFVDGMELSGAKKEGMLRVVDSFKKLGGYWGGLAVTSINHGIPTGSSDSGAAALARALNDFFELNLPQKKLLNIARYGSETAFRSLCGGLSEYVVEGVREPAARVVASPASLAGIVFYGIGFEGRRRSADELHLAVVGHPRYRARNAQTRERIDQLKDALAGGELCALLKLMEDDARTFHTMVEELGMPVRAREMLSLCQKTELWRRHGLESYWNVAGGNTVYVFTLRGSENEVLKKILEEGHAPTKYKIAGAAKTI